MGHLALCVILSIYVVSSLRDELSGWEILLIIWFGSLALEEIRQLFGWELGDTLFPPDEQRRDRSEIWQGASVMWKDAEGAQGI